jgi:hypothetical protein
VFLQGGDHVKWFSMLAAVAALVTATPAAAQPAAAQTASSAFPVVGLGMTMPEYQGMGCLLGGVVGATGVYAYSDIITTAATGMLNPLLLVPVMATGLAVGCGVGSTVSPVFLWIGSVINSVGS